MMMAWLHNWLTPFLATSFYSSDRGKQAIKRVITPFWLLLHLGFSWVYGFTQAGLAYLFLLYLCNYASLYMSLRGRTAIALLPLFAEQPSFL